MCLEVRFDTETASIFYLTTWKNHPNEGGDWLSDIQGAELCAIRAHEHEELQEMLTKKKKKALTKMKEINAKQLKQLKKKHKVEMD